MSSVTDQKSPDAAKPPRGWLRATLVAVLAVVFVGSRGRFCQVYLAIARR